MGQAKNRGTFAERLVQAPARREAEAQAEADRLPERYRAWRILPKMEPYRPAAYYAAALGVSGGEPSEEGN